MKILVVGGTGMIGTALVSLLKKDHEVIAVGRTKGDYQADIMDKASIEKMFDEIKDLDGVISLTGGAPFGPVQNLTDEDFSMALSSKLMGQINLIREGIKHVKENGFIITTSGTVTTNPMPGTSTIAMANGGLEAFVKALKVEDTNNLRINVVSPAMVTESAALYGMDVPYTVSAADTAKVYEKVLLGDESFTVTEIS